MYVAGLLFTFETPAFGAQNAVDASLFGISLEKPLTIAECPLSKNFVSGYDHFTPGNHEGLCAERHAARTKAWGTSAISLYFPFMKGPHYLQNFTLGEVRTELIDDKVAFISFSTGGVSAHENVFTVLKEKFGVPTNIANRTVPGNPGEPLSVVDSTWKFPRFVITYNEMPDDPGWGQVTASTEEYEKTYKDWTANQKASEPKL